MTTRRRLLAQAGALGAASVHIGLKAQVLPAARLISGFPPGGTIDAVCKKIAEKLQGNYASSVVVDHRPGAAGQIGVKALIESPADGSAMLLTPSSMLSLYPYVYKALPYEPLVDLQSVSTVCHYNHGLALGPAVPESVKTVKDFLAWAKANPERATYCSPSAGSMAHLIGVMLSKLSGVKLKHVAYRGAAPAVQDLMAGQVSAMSAPIGAYLPHLSSGRLRLITISGINRSPFVPDVPTYRQQGYPITVREWDGLYLPGKAGPDVVRRAAAYLQPALNQRDFVFSLAQLGVEVRSSSPEAIRDLLQADFEEWRRLIRQIGFTPES